MAEKATATEKQQIDPHSLNTYQKLIMARNRFLARNVKKSGVNRQLEFQYFELQDIVPTATRIFKDIGLVGIVNFDTNPEDGQAAVAVMTIINADRPTDTAIQFAIPYREVEQIKSKSGNTVTNPLQALGSSVTYLRRYLWMLALDIVEQDDVDANLGNEEKPAAESAPAAQKEKAAPKKPATPKERENIKVSLTGADDQADELMVNGLKSALKALRTRDDKQEEFIQSVVVETGGFKKVSRSKCEELIKTVQSMIAEYDKTE